MLAVKELNKRLSHFSLNNIDFHLPKGYIMGLIGANGSGKSTLIKTILNVYNQDSGDVCIDGINIKDNAVEAKNLIGFVLDENFFQPNFTIEENGLLLGKFYTKYNHKLFLDYINSYKISPNIKLKKLSKGNLMKFQLAFALSHDAKLFIFDEPTASLDPEFSNEFYRLMTDIISDGERSILISTHLTDSLDRLADYITFLNNGKQVFSLSKEELTSRYKVVSGDDYKIKQIPSEMIIYSEAKSHATKALVYNKNYYKFDFSLTIEDPNIDDIMYYMIKGDFKNVEAVKNFHIK